MEEGLKKSLGEVYFVIQNSDSNIIKKIPDNFLDFIKNNMNKYNIKINIQDSNWKNNISEDAKAILSLIYRDYLISSEERKKLLHEEENKRIEAEQILREKYNPNNLFKNKNNAKITNSRIQKEDVFITKYKEKKFWQKFWDKIRFLLKT